LLKTVDSRFPRSDPLSALYNEKLRL
jgi:hypothetical protein